MRTGGMRCSQPVELNALNDAVPMGVSRLSDDVLPGFFAFYDKGVAALFVSGEGLGREARGSGGGCDLRLRLDLSSRRAGVAS
jgi:hypothetical protein